MATSQKTAQAEQRLRDEVALATGRCMTMADSYEFAAECVRQIADMGLAVELAEILAVQA